MWHDHWRLSGDPFPGPGSPYVRTTGHDEALARLVHTIEAGGRLAVLRAGAGLGKSVVLARAILATKGPQRRFARVSFPTDGVSMLAGLAGALGGVVPSGPGRPAAWKALGDAVKLCRWQKLHAVLVVDDCQELGDPADARDLERLAQLDPHPSTRLTVVQAFREPDEVDEGRGFAIPSPPAWELSIRLPPLTRSESLRFVAEKVAAAGRSTPVFTPLALVRLHDLSGGVPRGLDRLGSLALMAGASRGLELVTHDVVDGVARECSLPRSGSAT